MKLIAILMLLASPAMAETRCAFTPAVEMALTEKYAETVRQTIERAPDGQPDLIVTWRLWVSDAGTWTVTGTNGATTCLFASGNDYDGRKLADFFKTGIKT